MNGSKCKPLYCVTYYKMLIEDKNSEAIYFILTNSARMIKLSGEVRLTSGQQAKVISNTNVITLKRKK